MGMETEKYHWSLKVIDNYLKEVTQKDGFCTKYQQRCYVGGNPPKENPNNPCFINKSGWIIESSTGCGNWRP